MRKLHRIHPCSFVSSIFYDLADNYVALDWSAEKFDFVDKQNSESGETAKIGSKRKLDETDENIEAGGDTAKKPKVEEGLEATATSQDTSTSTAIQLPKILDFKDQKYKFETEKFLIDKYSYAYLFHLQDTKEYLGKALLVMHNLKVVHSFLESLWFD